MPGCQAILARELTKKFEEFLRGTPDELMQALKTKSPKGEFVVLVNLGPSTSQAGRAS